jgi:type IV pilus assembly protein PilB
MSSGIRKMIIEGETSDEIEEQARKEGMSSLRDEGIKKIIDGVTTIDEVGRETQVR